jgi:hypothetical protein
MTLTPVPTHRSGATTKASDMVYAPPGRQVTDASLRQDLADVGLNTAFVADLLSAVAAHERAGRQLYRSIAGRTENPVLRRRYTELGHDTERHLAVLEL